MSRIDFGSSASGTSFNGEWRSPWFVGGQGNVIGLWVECLRTGQPDTWDQAGWVNLVLRTNPTQQNFSLDRRVILFERRELFLFPLQGRASEYRLEIDSVEWLNLLNLEFGSVVQLPEDADSIESVIDSLTELITILSLFA